MQTNLGVAPLLGKGFFVPKISLPRQWKFGSIPEEVLNSSLSIYAKVLVGAITYHAFDDGESWPGQSRLSKLCSCSIPSINRATKELEEAGFLKIERRFGTTSKYQFISKNTPIPQIAVEIKPLSRGHDHKPNPYPKDRTPLSHRQTNETKERNFLTSLNEREKRPVTAGELVDRFLNPNKFKREIKT